MGGIDPKTVLLMTGTLGGVMALVLFLLRRSYLPAVMGIGFWALSLAIRSFNVPVSSFSLLRFKLSRPSTPENGCVSQRHRQAR